MNRIFILGNGFDLAHGKKTCYAHFITSYQNHAIEEFKYQNYFEDNLLTIDKSSFLNEPVTTFNELSKTSGFKWKNNLFGEMCLELHNSDRDEEKKWVEIEYFYFKKLSNIATRFNPNNEKGSLQVVRTLNKEFLEIQDLLHTYLKTIPHKTDLIPEMINLFTHKFNHEISLYLSFNYTNIIQQYFDQLELNFRSYQGSRSEYVPYSREELIHIHGQLDDETNPMIFGYGDQHDKVYAQLENFNNKEYLKNIKYHKYNRTNGFKKLDKYLSTNREIEVHIIGHSCGLSDRTLLNHIFQHEHCKNIIIHHYQDRDNFDDISLEITRHFLADKIPSMQKIETFNEANACPQLNDQSC